MKDENPLDKRTSLIKKVLNTLLLRNPTKFALSVLLGVVLQSVSDIIFRIIGIAFSMPISACVALSFLILNVQTLFTHQALDEEQAIRLYYLKKLKQQLEQQQQEEQDKVETSQSKSAGSEPDDAATAQAERKKNQQLRNLKESHLIDQLLQDKTSGNFIIYFSLFFALFGEYVLYTQTQEMSLAWVMAVTVILLLGNFVNQRILKYRANHGLYGTCYSEAKEIVSFILEWHRKNGNSNGKPPKLVFTQEELDECLQVNGGEEYAR